MSNTRSTTSRARNNPPVQDQNPIPEADQTPPETRAPEPNSIEFVAQQLQSLTHILTQFMAHQNPPSPSIPPPPPQNSRSQNEPTRFSEFDEGQHTESIVDLRKENIMADQLPKKVNLPKIEPYKGLTDHLCHYQHAMSLHDYTDSLLCRVFPNTLKGPALAWFWNIPPSPSIRSQIWE